MSLLCDKLAEKDKGALILIDEVRTPVAMREVAASYQELVGDRKNIAIAMAGLPHAVPSVLNDSVLTFPKLGKKGSAIQPYRKRLIESGVIEAPRRGELVFAVPYLSEYLLNIE